MSRRTKVVAGVLFFLALLVYAGNSSRFSSRAAGSPVLLAHRGVNQRFDIPVESNTCLAVHLIRPRHQFLENTIPSMKAAFERGADVVEFDIQATVDGQFAVFHDRTLECKTNGQGLTRAHTMAQLKALDIGYGYTFDGGRTYPLRGEGIGLMPSMDEIFEKLPMRSFLLDVKSNEPSEGMLLAEHLSRLSSGQRSRLMIFGRDTILASLRQRLPELRVFSATSTARCLVGYMAYGWIGVIPGACRNAPIFVPINLTPWLWGWPNRFMNRMSAGHGSIILMGEYPAQEISPGLDSPDDLARIPRGYDGGVWTNDIDLVRSTMK